MPGCGNSDIELAAVFFRLSWKRYILSHPHRLIQARAGGFFYHLQGFFDCLALRIASGKVFYLNEISSSGASSKVTDI